MILDGVCYPVIHFRISRVILYVRRSPFVVSQSLSGRLSTSAASSSDATLLIIHSSYHLFKTLDLPSGEDVLH